MEQPNGMGGNSELLGYFSAEGVFRTLRGFDFSTGKLPHSGS